MTSPQERRCWEVVGSNRENLVHVTPDEAIEDALDGMDVTPETITAQEFAPMAFDVDAEEILASVLEPLEEEFGDPDGGSTAPTTEAMLAAAQQLASVIKAEYVPWMMEPTGRTVTVNCRAWIREHRPDWLSDDAAAYSRGIEREIGRG